MKLYEIILKPCSAFVTPLKADTVFGSFCWQAALDETILTGGLETWVACYHARPAVVFSSAWPSLYEKGLNLYAFKRPDLPLSMLFVDSGQSARERLANRKETQRKKWLLVKGDLRMNLEKTNFVDDCCLAKKMAGLDGPESRVVGGSNTPPLQWEAERMHNTINRLTMTAGEGFAPFSRLVSFYLPGTKLVVFALIDEEASDIERVCLALERIGTQGFGADASTGYGRFQLGGYDEIPFPVSRDANAVYCLGPAVPEKSLYREMFFRPFVRFGRHGDRLAMSSDPFKNPVIMADEGAVFVPANERVLEKPYLGRAVTDVSKAMPETIHQGYAIHIPFRLELDHV